MGLGPLENLRSKEQYPPLPHPRLQRGNPVLQVRLSPGPAAPERLPAVVPGDRPESGGGGIGAELEHGTVVEEDVGVLLHPRGNRMGEVDPGPEHRAGNVEPGAGERGAVLGQVVLDRKSEPGREVGGRAPDGDDGASVLDEFPDPGQGVFRGHPAEVIAVFGRKPGRWLCRCGAAAGPARGGTGRAGKGPGHEVQHVEFRVEVPGIEAGAKTRSKGNSNCSRIQRVHPEGIEPPYTSQSPTRGSRSRMRFSGGTAVPVPSKLTPSSAADFSSWARVTPREVT